MKYVNLALVGCGDFMVHAHVPQLLKVPEIRVVALCDSRRGAAENCGWSGSMMIRKSGFSRIGNTC